MTLEEQMICGALQTLNEEAFEDVASERPSPTGGGPSTGETIALTPIQETAELDRSLAYLKDGTADRLQLHTISLSNSNISSLNSNSNNNNNNSDNLSNRSDHHNRMGVAMNSNELSEDDDSDCEVINMSGLNAHESIPSKSQTPTTNTTLTLEHESNRKGENSNHTAISMPPASSSPSHVVLMPDEKIHNNLQKTSIHDTHF